MTHKEYNGWTNYETWAVALWLDNDEQSQGYWRDMARECLDMARQNPSEVLSVAQDAAYQLADRIKEEHEEALPEVTGFASDLLNAAMSEVNWQEIAKGFVSEALEESEATR